VAGAGVSAPVYPAAMGRKSPAKWIKTVLFGKKSSKSFTVKGREVIISTQLLLVNIILPALSFATFDSIIYHAISLEEKKREDNVGTTSALHSFIISCNYYYYYFLVSTLDHCYKLTLDPRCVVPIKANILGNNTVLQRQALISGQKCTY
jgi:hypothetical protein